MGRKRIKTITFLVFLLLIILGNTSLVLAEEGERICQGVFIDEVEVGGMTKKEAEAALEDFVDSLREKGIAIMVNDNIVYSNLGELGYDMLENDFIDQALSIGKRGNLIKRYKELKDIEYGGHQYLPEYTVDEDKIERLVAENVASYNIKPVNASVKRANGGFVYTDHEIGNKVEVEETSNLIADIISNDWNRTDVFVEAIMSDDIPLYTRDVVEKCNSLLGTFSTTYANSAQGRAANLANGAKLIDNAIIYPGEVFSAYEYLTPFTVENGYYNAGAYAQGKVVDSIGGGACQVTTTLYNAALYAELEIVERQAHSMTISYVDLSRDAAIAGTYKDLKFRNNTDVPIIIEAFTEGRKITFNIWGHESRDSNRRIKYVTKVLKETSPPADIVTKDPNQLETYRRVTQSAHTGYVTELYKEVYINDEKVSETLVNKSYYNANPRYVTIGTKPVEEEEAEDDSKPVNNVVDNDKKEDKKDKKKKDKGEDNKVKDEAPPKQELPVDIDENIQEDEPLEVEENEDQ